MRKSLIALAAGVSVVLTACGGGAADTTESSAPAETTASESTEEASVDATEEAPAGEGTITMWADDTRTDDFKKIGEMFAEQSGITVDVIQKPTGDIANDFVTQVPAGQGPDLIVTAHDNLGNLHQNGVVAPIDFAAKADAFNPVAVQAFTLDGQVWGLPYAMENIALVRNNALAEDTPATLDELIEQGKGIDGVEYPLVVQQGEAGDAYHLYPVQTSFGAPVFTMEENDEGLMEYTTELGMAGPEGQAFAEYLQKLGQEGILSADIGGDQAKQLFLDEKTPYMITGPWNTAEFTEAGLDISVLPVPSAGGEPSAPFVGVQGVFVSAQTENAILANQFIDFLATPEAQTELYNLGGRAPALTESADAIDDEIIAGFNEAGKDGQPMPVLAEMGAVWEFWGTTEVQLINGQASDAKAAWDTMNENIKSKF